MAGDEQFLSWDLADAVAGKPPRDDVWRGATGLAALKQGTGSINMPLLRLATKLWAGTPAEQAAAIADWKEVLTFFQGQWMGSELGSRIYGVWHLLSVAAAFGWADANGNPELSALAQGWLLHWWCLMKLIEAPDGRLLMVGMRSGGHEPNAGFLEWVWALATDGPVPKWEATAKTLGLGLKQNWIYAAGMSLKEVLRKSAAPIREGQDPAALIPNYGLVVPYNVLKTEGGMAVWIPENRNGNTTPVAGVVWTPQSLDWLPKNGGRRIRQQFEKIDCRIDGANLVYDSILQGHDELPLPPGQVLARVTLPIGTADSGTTMPPGPTDGTTGTGGTGTTTGGTGTTTGGTTGDGATTPPTPPPPDTKPAPPSQRSPQAIADDVLKLAVPKIQGPDRRRLADEVRLLPAGRPPAEIAADVGKLGISQGQLTFWHNLQAELASWAPPPPPPPVTPPPPPGDGDGTGPGGRTHPDRPEREKIEQ
jgi:hypothetical protein